MDAEKGSGAGSGQDRHCEVKDLGVGTRRASSRAFVLWCRSLMGSNALVKNSFADLVWL